MKGLLNNKKGQAIPVEYILIITLSLVFLGLATMALNSTIESSSRQAIYIELTDVGNVISSAITNTYLTAPVDGINTLTVEVPIEIAGTGYFMEISDENDNPFEQGVKALKLMSVRKGVTVYVPLNSVDVLVDINGSASSASGKIAIMSNNTGITISQG